MVKKELNQRINGKYEENGKPEEVKRRKKNDGGGGFFLSFFFNI